MKRLILKKLIVISQSESRSLEIPFSLGLNIIYGGNKTGKSSIIKSIFFAFGCECKKVEKDWKKLISNYLIFFKYGELDYCISRENKKFQIFQVMQNEYKCIIQTEHFHEYSNRLMELFEIIMPCISNEGKEFNITPPLLFRFQYIDQDEGWNKIGDSFSNVKYIKDWKINTNKFVTGYLPEDYFKLRVEIVKACLVKEQLEKKLLNNQEFVEQIMIPQIEQDVLVKPEDIEIEILDLIECLDKKREDKFELKHNIGELENTLYVTTRKIEMLKTNSTEVEKDIKFAMSLNESIICPSCGTKTLNNLENQMSLSVDLATTENMITALASEITELKQSLDNNYKKYEKLSLDIDNLTILITEMKKTLSYLDFVRKEGEQGFYKKCLDQLNVDKRKIEDQVSQIAQWGERANKMKNTDRLREIKEFIEDYCRQIAKIINISSTFIKLRDFVQIINHTGSDTPRLVYMYQSALYLYNLDRGQSPFNFLIIDTPNQQGQDKYNLSNIYESLELFINTNGQVILGTERKTGCEEKASNVIQLIDKRRCLKDNRFSIHKALLTHLQWVADLQ